jgi:hypothetical protein
MIIKTFKYLTVFASICFFTSCTYEDLDDQSKVLEIIQQESELYSFLERSTNNDNLNGRPIITCIDFLYPLFLYTTDVNDDIVTSQNLSTDEEFAVFLSSIATGNNISISYPIEATVGGITTVSINNNDELLLSIEQCIEEEQEEIIAYCTSLIESCIWKVGYSFENESEYLGAVFDGNGATYFSYNEVENQGSWNALYIESVLHMNINLIQTSNESNYFNKNWKAEIVDSTTIKLTNSGLEVILNKYCEVDDNNCFNLNFEKCEDLNDLGHSNFILNEYDACILEILRIDANSTPTYLSYYKTLIDANTSSNNLDPSSPYRNITTNQEMYVRVEDATNMSFRVIKMTINAIACI